jgi:hypothetical protein
MVDLKWRQNLEGEEADRQRRRALATTANVFVELLKSIPGRSRPRAHSHRELVRGRSPGTEPFPHLYSGVAPGPRFPILEFPCSREQPKRVPWSLTGLLRPPFRLQRRQLAA